MKGKEKPTVRKALTVAAQLTGWEKEGLPVER